MHAISLSLPELSLLVVTALFLALPVWWAWRMGWNYLVHRADPPIPDSALPPVAVILPLRGADPSLRDCLRGLLNQDYPRYSVRIVVDSPDDPAWELVPAILAEGHGPNVEVRMSALRRHCGTCTLKISAQMQAVAELEDEFAVIALIDADALPPRNWLRALVAPFADPEVSAVTGVRWYAPTRPTWGTLVRHLWNAASQPQMMAFGHPWGGTLALPAHLLREGHLLAQWQRSFCDDSGIGELLRRLGLKLRTLPALTMVNREDIDLRGCVRFLRRQLLCPRLDMSNWPIILLTNAGCLLALGVAFGFAVAGLALGHLPWLVWFGTVFLLHVVGMASALCVGEWRIRQIVRARGQEMPPPAPAWRLLAASLLVEVIQCYCLVAAVCARRVSWRGVDYHIVGPKRIQLLQYRPFRAMPGPVHSERSIV